MIRQFRQHYTREEARALLPLVREWLGQLTDLRERLGRFDKRLSSLLAQGFDVGGETVSGWARAVVESRRLLQQFEAREIQLKDLDRGLVDFPAIREGREVFLCWEEGEDDIDYWHELDGGYGGREKLGLGP